MIYIQTYPESRYLPLESLLVYEYAMRNGLGARYFRAGELPALAESDLVVGSVESLRDAFSRLGVPVPAPDYYPDCLGDYLHRRVWQASWAEAMDYARRERVFVKSRDWKRLTGAVFAAESVADMQALGLPPEMPCWLSTPVVWRAEFRVYVTGDRIVDVCQYGEDPDAEPDRAVIEHAVALLCQHQPQAARAVDFGILASGETALVEVNDAWAIGAYPGIGMVNYFLMLQARWQELTLRPRQQDCA